MKKIKLPSLKWETSAKIIGFTVFGLVQLSSVAFANEFTDLETNATKLAKDLGGIITGVAAASTTAKVGWHMWMRSLADGDQGAIQDHNKRMKNTLIWGGGITALGAILMAVVGAVAGDIGGTPDA